MDNNKNMEVGKIAKGLNISEIAAIHGLEADALQNELLVGIKEEMDAHTDNPEIAKAIVLDHLYENPNFYNNKSKMGKIEEHYEDLVNVYELGGTTDPMFNFVTPTKEKSELSYLQQVLVRLKGFKDFFGDWETAAKNFLLNPKGDFNEIYKGVSKVINSGTLEPLCVYHGTRLDKEFYTFDATNEKNLSRPYAYFAYNREYSEVFTLFSQRNAANSKPFLYQCFVSVKKPFSANGINYFRKLKDAKGWIDSIVGSIVFDKYQIIDRTDKRAKDLEKVINSQISKYVKDVIGLGTKPFWSLMAADVDKEFKFFLMSHDYDGILYAEEIKSNYDVNNKAEFSYAVCAFNASQIKLADGRNLDFDPLNPDIRFDRGGNVYSDKKNTLSKRERLDQLILGNHYFAEGGDVVSSNGSRSNDGKKGGYFDGRSHADGGIKAINVDTGQLIEVEGEEVIITKRAVNDNEKREFEGEMLTNREILSKINQSGGGVAFAKGGELDVPACGCTGRKYKYGGKVLQDYMIIRDMQEPYNTNDKSVRNSKIFVEDLIKKMK